MELMRQDTKATLNKCISGSSPGQTLHVFNGRKLASITRVIDDSALRVSPFGPAAPFNLRLSRATHLCAAATLTYTALP